MGIRRVLGFCPGVTGFYILGSNVPCATACVVDCQRCQLSLVLTRAITRSQSASQKRQSVNQSDAGEHLSITHFSDSLVRWKKSTTTISTHTHARGCRYYGEPAPRATGGYYPAGLDVFAVTGSCELDWFRVINVAVTLATHRLRPCRLCDGINIG